MKFDPVALFVSLIFGLIGMGAWRYGRRETSARHLYLAVTLMLFPYFVANVWLMAAVGTALTVLLFWP